jgi:hypothetical protein
MGFLAASLCISKPVIGRKVLYHFRHYPTGDYGWQLSSTNYLLP